MSNQNEMKEHIVNAIAMGFNGTDSFVFKISAKTKEGAIKTARDMIFFRVRDYSEDDIKKYMAARKESSLRDVFDLDFNEEEHFELFKLLFSRLSDEQRIEIFNSYNP